MVIWMCYRSPTLLYLSNHIWVPTAVTSIIHPLYSFSALWRLFILIYLYVNQIFYVLPMNEHLYIIIVPQNSLIISLRSYKQLEKFEASPNKEMINIYVLEKYQTLEFCYCILYATVESLCYIQRIKRKNIIIKN